MIKPYYYEKLCFNKIIKSFDNRKYFTNKLINS